MSIYLYMSKYRWTFFFLFLTYARAFFSSLTWLCDLKCNRNSLKRFLNGTISIEPNAYDFVSCVRPLCLNTHTWILMWLENRYEKCTIFNNFSSNKSYSKYRNIKAENWIRKVIFTVVSLNKNFLFFYFAIGETFIQCKYCLHKKSSTWNKRMHE